MYKRQPDINKGGRTFSVDGKAIRYGLSAIKSVGGTVIDKIVEERRKNGSFTSLKDFIDRVSDKEVNKKMCIRDRYRVLLRSSRGFPSQKGIHIHIFHLRKQVQAVL